MTQDGDEKHLIVDRRIWPFIVFVFLSLGGTLSLTLGVVIWIPAVGASELYERVCGTLFFGQCTTFCVFEGAQAVWTLKHGGGFSLLEGGWDFKKRKR